MSTSETQQAIMTAAIGLFLAKGYVSTTIADIRLASGATTGSIYHFFGTKAGIAVAIWDAAISGWQQRFQDAAEAVTAEVQIRASVRAFLDWARSDPRQFRVYDEILTLSRSLVEFAPIAQRIADGQNRAATLYDGWVMSGQVADIAWPLARALIMGPSLEYLRSHPTLDEAAMERLVSGAWEAVKCR